MRFQLKLPNVIIDDRTDLIEQSLSTKSVPEENIWTVSQ